ncbi:MAG: hypothetical protein ACRDZO_17530 [Egibacteraceae bacterium]
MTGRFTRSARAVVIAAVERAHRDGANEIREEHLFAAVVNEPAVRPLLGEVSLPADVDAVVAEVRQARRRVV